MKFAFNIDGIWFEHCVIKCKCSEMTDLQDTSDVLYDKCHISSASICQKSNTMYTVLSSQYGDRWEHHSSVSHRPYQGQHLCILSISMLLSGDDLSHLSGPVTVDTILHSLESRYYLQSYQVCIL